MNGSSRKAALYMTWQQRKGARRRLRADPHSNNLGKAVNMDGKNPKVRAVLSVFCAFVLKLGTLVQEGDQAGLYKHLQMINLEGKRYLSWAYVEDEDGILLTDVDLIREGWLRWLHTFLNAKSPTFCPNIVEGLDRWSEKTPLVVQPTMQELSDAIRSLKNGKAVGPDEVSVELIKITFSAIPPCDGDCSISSFVFEGGEMPQQWKMPSSPYSTQQGSERMRQLQGYRTCSARRRDTAGDYRALPQRIRPGRREYGEGVGALPKEQRGFRQTSSTTDTLFVVGRLQELAPKKLNALYTCVIEHTKACEAVD